jgi:hypothetical protein
VAVQAALGYTAPFVTDLLHLMGHELAMFHQQIFFWALVALVSLTLRSVDLC